MYYKSTRNSEVKVSSAQAIAQGISVDGGLFVPEEIPSISMEDLKKLGEQDYRARAKFVPLVNVPLENFASQQKVLFNFGWKFQLVTNENKNTDFASPALDDSSWRTLDLPHDFQFEQPWTENGGGARGFKPMCEGWYRKSFPTDPSWKGKRVVLDFGGTRARPRGVRQRRHYHDLGRPARTDGPSRPIQPQGDGYRQRAVGT